MLVFLIMIKISLRKGLKKWIPIFFIVSIIVIMMGFIFHSSVPQILSSVAISILLIFSALLFQSTGRGRESRKSKFNDQSNDEIK